MQPASAPLSSTAAGSEAPPLSSAPPASSPDAVAERLDDMYLTRPPGTFSLDDYRWVAVRRKPRLDGWTEEKQRRFIETLADTGLVSAAAKAVGMTRESAYKLRRAAHATAFARLGCGASPCGFVS